MKIDDVLTHFDAMVKAGSFSNSAPARNAWAQYTSAPEDEVDYMWLKDRLAGIREGLSRIVVADTKDPKGRQPQQFLAYDLHWLLSNIAYRFAGQDYDFSSECRSQTKGLSRDYFFPLTDHQREALYSGCFQYIFGLLDDHSNYLGEHYQRPPISVRHSYTSSDNMWLNQRFLPVVPDEMLGKLHAAMAESGLDRVLNAYYNASYSVINIRVWKYCVAQGAGSNEVSPHFDCMPPGMLKLMYFGGDITPKHGCFEALDLKRPQMKRGNKKQTLNRKVVYQVTGHNPAILVDSHNLFHQALSPQPGFTRNTIELSIIPYFPGEEVHQEAGCCSIAPLNPFDRKTWMSRIESADKILNDHRALVTA